jgi:chemotaxis protein MotB
MNVYSLQKNFYLLMATVVFSSCVASKKYDDLLARKDDLERQKTISDQNLTEANSRLKSLSAQVSDLQTETERLRNDTTQIGTVLRRTKALYAELNNSYDKLLKNSDRMVASKASEASKLSSDLARRESELRALEESNEKLGSELKAREEKVTELERVLAEKERAVTNLKNTVSNALLGFKDNDLTVDVKNGKVYVSLAEQLLFKSGSTKIDPKGQDALKKLAVALQGQQDVNVLVEGHTDDVPIARSTPGMQDNWDLSVLRATEITRILTNAGLDRVRVTPSGRADTVPLQAGRTPDSRRMNRRTEIILTPKLDELFKILE